MGRVRDAYMGRVRDAYMDTGRVRDAYIRDAYGTRTGTRTGLHKNHAWDAYWDAYGTRTVFRWDVSTNPLWHIGHFHPDKRKIQFFPIVSSDRTKS